MSDIGGNEGETSESETDSSSDAHEKSELHQTEATAGDVSEAEKPADSTEAAADQAEKSLMAQAAAQDDWSNAGLQTENVVYPPPTPPTIQVGLMLNTDVAINVFFIVTIDTV